MSFMFQKKKGEKEKLNKNISLEPYFEGNKI